MIPVTISLMQNSVTQVIPVTSNTILLTSSLAYPSIFTFSISKDSSPKLPITVGKTSKVDINPFSFPGDILLGQCTMAGTLTVNIHKNGRLFTVSTSGHLPKWFPSRT